MQKVAMTTPAATQVGVARRIRALMALGWPSVDIAREMNLAQLEVESAADGLHVSPESAERVRAEFVRLEMIPGRSSAVRDRARRSGWAVPFDWDEDSLDDPSAHPVRPGRAVVVDDVVVRRMIAGIGPVYIRAADRRAYCAELVARGCSVDTVSRSLKVSGSVAARLISELREAADSQAA